jgi:hypothetical protein
MRRTLDAARDEHDIVLVDLGELRAGAQSAIGSALSDRTILVASCGEHRQRINAALDLLDRLAPDRFLMALNRMPAADPLLVSGPIRTDGGSGHPGWLTHTFKT